MANALKMAIVESVFSLHALGWKQRRIARELGIDRETVRKYLRQRLCAAKPANAPTGSEQPKPAASGGLPGLEAKPANAPIGAAADGGGATAADSPTGGPAEAADPQPAAAAVEAERGPGSQCVPYREAILAKVAEGLSIKRIHQDLAADGKVVHYDSLRRYVRRLGRVRPLPFRRMECEPGAEAQVDFGSGAPVVTPEGKRRKTHVFRMVISHSRKGYSEVTFSQKTDDFLRALENGFRHFGGVPKTLVIDNLKAAVAHPDWFDPELTPKVQSFCQHYGTVILPTRPYTPRHKGKVESGVKYVKNNALKGCTFDNLRAEQEHLGRWEATTADTRIHGTHKKQVGALFEAVERAALLPLPAEPFANFQEKQHKVYRDGHVEVAKAYYSAPPEYVGRSLWVRWDARLVRLFNHRWEQVALHVRQEPGRFSTLNEHLPAEKISGVERGASWLLSKVSVIGNEAHQWAQAMLHARGIAGTRVLQGLVSLQTKHSSEALEKACKTALSYGAYRLRTIRHLLARQPAVQMPLPFLDEHPIIRPLDDYAQVVARAFHRQEDRPSVGEGFGRHGWTKVSPVSISAPVPSTKNPGSEVALGRGPADTLPPRSDYPSPGCSSAEPGSVSPDASSVVPRFPPHQEKSP
ncbi:MAG TPA: IS21 family transposase [Pirellulales bacterium]|nr:IS21 family transposase [Pirellulales bacterium]